MNDFCGRIKVLICGDIIVDEIAFSNYLRNKGFVVQVSDLDYEAIFETIEYSHPNVVIIDAMSKNIDVVSLMEKSRKYMAKIHKDIKFIVSVPTVNLGLEKILLEKGSDYNLIKPYSLKLGADVVTSLTATTELEANNNIEIITTNIMHKLGIPANFKGYHFVREAIVLTFLDSTIVNGITKKLYPTIAKKFNTTSPNVERGIRKAIEIAWLRNGDDMTAKYFGHALDNGKIRPTNREFISVIADMITVKYRYKMDKITNEM